MMTSCLSGPLGEVCRKLLAAALIAHNCGSIPEPPDSYVHLPDRMIDIRPVSWGTIQRECGAAIPIPEPMLPRDGMPHWQADPLIACTSGAYLNLIWIKADEPEHEQACHVRHELGHVNGWPWWHPHAIFE